MNHLTTGGVIFIGVGLAVAAVSALMGRAAARLSRNDSAHPEMHTARYYGKSYLVGGLSIAGIGVVVLIIGLANR